MSEQIGPLFPTQVPAYTEPADIRKAFNLYHYGTEAVPTELAQILPESIAGYIRDTLDAIDNIQEGISVVTNLGIAQNLDDINITGIYHSTASPTTALGYPTTINGVVSVVNSNDTTYQTYQTAGSTNNFYFRSTNFGTSTWSAWSLASKDGHTHDTRYYTQGQINSRLDLSPTAGRVAILDANSKVTSSLTVSTTQLDYLDGLGSNVQTQINNKSDINHNHNSLYYTKTEQPKIFVQSGTPSGAVTGDLWFW